MKHVAAPDHDLDEPGSPCEVCSYGGRQCAAVEAFALGERLLWLCAEHRTKAEAAPSEAALRELFREPDGQRSLLPRRAEERRVFPPRPEGRRKGSGRRRADPSV